MLISCSVQVVALKRMASTPRRQKQMYSPREKNDFTSVLRPLIDTSTTLEQSLREKDQYDEIVSWCEIKYIESHERMYNEVSKVSAALRMHIRLRAFTKNNFASHSSFDALPIDRGRLMLFALLNREVSYRRSNRS